MTRLARKLTKADVTVAPYTLDLTPQQARDLLDDDAYLRDLVSRYVSGADVHDLWHGTEYVALWIGARALGNTEMPRPTAFRGDCAEVCAKDGRRPAYTGRVYSHLWNPYFNYPYYSTFEVCQHPRHAPWTTRAPEKNPSHLDYDGPLPEVFRDTNTYSPPCE
jgi:hypothetical protein